MQRSSDTSIASATRKAGAFRHAAALAAAVLWLAGCSSDQDRTLANLATLIRSRWSAPEKVTREQAAATPVATIGMRVGDGPEQMLGLVMTLHDTDEWGATNGVSVATTGGRIVGTTGLAMNLTGFRGPLRQNDASSIPRDGDAYALEYDFANENRYGVRAHCTIGDLGPAEITIIGSQISTEKISERCSAPEIGWSFENLYWRDPQSGFVWRTRQTVHPGLDPITIEVLRPPPQ